MDDPPPGKLVSPFKDMPLMTELARRSIGRMAINMALLTELGRGMVIWLL